MMDYLMAIVPPIGVGALFALVIRYFVTADRRERAAQAKKEAEVARRLRENPPGNR